MLYEELEKEKSKQRVEEDLRIKKIEATQKLESFLEKLKQTEQDNIENFEKKTQQQKEQIELFEQKIEEIRIELLELEEKRSATVQSWKREEEIRIKQDFYRIVLTEQDKNDIEILNSIRKRLNNKDSLNRILRYRHWHHNFSQGIYKLQNFLLFPLTTLICIFQNKFQSDGVEHSSQVLFYWLCLLFHNLHEE